jgi:pantoate--beta-alanine ligase
MLIFSKITELREHLDTRRAQNQTIGFVPTMGALHLGHISLIHASNQQCDYTVCSIFVNPTQFNDKKDLEKYPRTPEADIQLLTDGNCDVLFMPSVEEMYTTPEKSQFDFGYLDKILEGRYRPGHFAGVAQIVKKLLEIVKPDKAFFGSKDYQQVKIVKALVEQMNLKTEIVSCPILREKDGLAMSSRNALLTAEERTTAGRIPGMLREAANIVRKQGLAEAKAFVNKETSSWPQVKLDYYEVCDPKSLMPLDKISPNGEAISLIALYVGNTRLIDNLPVATS